MKVYIKNIVIAIHNFLNSQLFLNFITLEAISSGDLLSQNKAYEKDTKRFACLLSNKEFG